jgi:hypothetical protein
VLDANGRNRLLTFLSGTLMNSPGLPSISGMVKVGSNKFLVIHDTKGPLGARLAAIRIQKEGQDTKSLEYATGRHTKVFRTI